MRSLLLSTLAIPLLAFAAPLTICNICDGAVVQRVDHDTVAVVCPDGTIPLRVRPCVVAHWTRQSGMLTITCG